MSYEYLCLVRPTFEFFFFFFENLKNSILEHFKNKIFRWEHIMKNIYFNGVN